MGRVIEIEIEMDWIGLVSFIANRGTDATRGE